MMVTCIKNLYGRTNSLGETAGLKKTESIPVIMVTALSDEKNIAGAQKAGAVEYVVKPFDYTVLLEKITQALKSKRKGA